VQVKLGERQQRSVLGVSHSGDLFETFQVFNGSLGSGSPGSGSPGSGSLTGARPEIELQTLAKGRPMDRGNS
jgi:hypothetical protein